MKKLLSLFSVFSAGKITKVLILGVFAAVSLVGARPALANYPMLTASYQGYGNNVQVNVSNADSYAQVNLYYRQSSSLWTIINNIGQTDQNGYFTTVISVPSDSGSSQVQMYVTVNGQQSSTVSVYPGGGSGCDAYGCAVGGFTINPQSLNLNVGQTGTVTASFPYPVSGTSVYVSNNTNPSVASASVSGNLVTVSAYSSGSTNMSICSSYGSSSCRQLYVTVSGSGYNYGNISFSPSNLSLSVGQNSTVYMMSDGGYFGNYYISNNTNPNSVSASVSSGSLYVSALSSGNSNITVCQSGTSRCGTLYVTVSGSSSGTGSVWFSPSSPSLYVGQSLAVSINSSSYGFNSSYSSPYYISSNSNSGVVTASISGTVINLYANAAGSSNISVCHSSLGYCGTLYVTVTGSGTGSGLYFSPSSLSLNAGQTATASIYGNSGYYGSYYISNNSNTNVATANLSGSTITVYAVNSGSTSITVCQNNVSNCAVLYVTVSGYGYGYGNISISQTNLNLSAGQTAAVNIYGSGSYYISGNSNSNVATASISGNTISIYARQNGNTTVYLCQSSSQNNCVSLYVQVSGYSYGGGLNYPGGNVLGATTYLNGQLISENGTVYMVYKNTKTGFTGANIFLNLGYKFSNVLEVGSSGLIDSGYTVSNSYASHPWGSWIKSGSTIYFVHESGLIPVPDWNTFINNGGHAEFVVNANVSDMHLPKLGIMVFSDNRLQ